MPKQRWRKSFKSVFASHINPENDEEIRGTKTEIDAKLQKILGLLNEEDGNDRKEALSDLIGDFHNHYESLYARYDHLTKELREKFDGSSSDSSESDDSPTKRGKRNGKVKNKVREDDAGVVKEELETALLEIDELKRKLAAAVDENDAVNLERQSVLSSKDEEFRQLEEEYRKMQIRNSEMERALIEKESEISNLQKRCEDGEGDASGKIAELSADLASIRDQLGFLDVQKREADSIIEKQSGEISDFLIQIEKLKEELRLAENQNAELANKINEQERKMKEQNDEFIKLGEDHKELEIQFRKCEESLKSSERELEQMQDQFLKVMDSKNQDINQLEETIEDLKTDLEIKEDEINTLMENMRNTEVKQRLTSQKLRITEQVLSEKEESHQERIEKLQEEQKLLEQRIASLLGTISTYKEAQLKIVSEISEKMNETLMEIDAFGVKFEEDYGHLESRIYEIGNELKVTMNWITGNNAEKDQLKNEIANLVQQLKDVKEQGLMLIAKNKELEMTLQKGEDERESLIRTVKRGEEKMGEMDEKMGELERKMNEKESEILRLCEEKREAIRQLCICIDHHQNRYDDLKERILNSTRGGRRQVAA